MSNTTTSLQTLLDRQADAKLDARVNAICYSIDALFSDALNQPSSYSTLVQPGVYTTSISSHDLNYRLRQSLVATCRDSSRKKHTESFLKLVEDAKDLLENQP